MVKELGLELTKLDLSIDEDGNWRHEGVEITHPRLLALLFSALQKMGAGHFVCADGLCVPVRVADCPYAVLSVRHQTDSVVLLLTDGSYETLQPQTLTLDGQNIPRCRVKDGRFTARFSRQAWMQLAEAITEAQDGGYELRIGDQRIQLPDVK